MRLYVFCHFKLKSLNRLFLAHRDRKQFLLQKHANLLNFLNNLLAAPFRFLIGFELLLSQVEAVVSDACFRACQHNEFLQIFVVALLGIKVNLLVTQLILLQKSGILILLHLPFDRHIRAISLSRDQTP
jgi:hypothetical protein